MDRIIWEICPEEKEQSLLIPRIQKSQSLTIVQILPQNYSTPKIQLIKVTTRYLIKITFYRTLSLEHDYFTNT